jgi:hypothetical protein
MAPELPLDPALLQQILAGAQDGVASSDDLGDVTQDALP